MTESVFVDVYIIFSCFFFFKQKTAYEMRISDWSSTCALPIYLQQRHRSPARLRSRQCPASAQRRERQMVCARLRAESDQEQCDHRQRRSEEHTSELQSLMRISYAVFCLKKKKKKVPNNIQVIQ